MANDGLHTTTAKNWQWCVTCGKLWSSYGTVCAPSHIAEPFPERLWTAVDAAFQMGGGDAVHVIERELWTKRQERAQRKLKKAATSAPIQGKLRTWGKHRRRTSR